jgi:hypothetical protein
MSNTKDLVHKWIETTSESNLPSTKELLLAKLEEFCEIENKKTYETVLRGLRGSGMVKVGGDGIVVYNVGVSTEQVVEALGGEETEGGEADNMTRSVAEQVARSIRGAGIFLSKIPIYI